MGMRPVTVIGAATSAGTHHAGQERAPDALRTAGLIERLVGAGITVTDHGNVVRETFGVDASGGPTRNEAATVRAARAVADAVARAARDGSLLLVLGGDCTITPSLRPASPTSTATPTSACPVPVAGSSTPWASRTCSASRKRG